VIGSVGGGAVAIEPAEPGTRLRFTLPG
jgi:hypothetical protein